MSMVYNGYMYIHKKGSSPRQMAYARRIFGGEGDSKRDIALSVGYTPHSAASVYSHIESKPGFHNAMALLAKESNNMAIKVMEEFKARGFKDFSNKDLVSALNAIGNAWSRFNPEPKKDPSDERKANNKLRTIILQQVENQTIKTQETKIEAEPPVHENVVDGEVNEELDF